MRGSTRDAPWMAGLAVTASLVRAEAAPAALEPGLDRAALDRIVQQKKAFIFGLSAGAFLFFLILPVLSFFTTVLDGRVYGALTWAYVFMFAQFAIGLICIHVFLARAAGFDAAMLAARATPSVPVPL